MYTIKPKKILILTLLDILKRYTDERHRLSQVDIINILKKEYHMKVDRKTIKRNLMNLIDFGYNISYKESYRINKVGEEEVLYSDWYIDRDFTDAELRLLIDSLLFSKHIPNNHRKQLIQKIEKLSNKYFKSKVKHIQVPTENYLENKELFYNIEILDQAISEKKQVQFTYNYYDIDKRLYPRRDGNGQVRNYLINPYQMVATSGKYYLICNYDKYQDVANYRIDRITNIELLHSSVKPMKEVRGLESGLDLPKHMTEHIYMFTGDSGRVRFQAKLYLITEILDWFGKDVKFTDKTEDSIIVTVYVNYKAMELWAMQYAKHIELLSPQFLVKRIREELQEAVEKYKKGNNY